MQASVPDAGSSQASVARIEGPGPGGTDVAAAWGEEAGRDGPGLCSVLLGLFMPPWAHVRVKGVMCGEGARAEVQ